MASNSLTPTSTRLGEMRRLSGTIGLKVSTSRKMEAKTSLLLPTKPVENAWHSRWLHLVSPG